MGPAFTVNGFLGGAIVPVGYGTETGGRFTPGLFDIGGLPGLKFGGIGLGGFLFGITLFPTRTTPFLQ